MNSRSSRALDLALSSMVALVASCAEAPPTSAPDARIDAPAADASMDAPADAPPTDAPAIDVRTADTAPLDAPSTDAPSTDAPSTDAPSTSDMPATSDMPSTVDRPIAADASLTSDVPCEAGACRRVVLGDPLTMDTLGNAGQTIALGPGPSYSLPYPLMANCTESDVCSPVTGMVLNNHVQWPRPWPQGGGAMERAVGFVVGFTAASPPAPASAGVPAGAGGFVVAGAPAGATDEGQVVVFFADPASPGDPFDGDNEYGFVRHTGTQGLGQRFVFYQQYSSNTGACQANSPLVDLTALGFNPALTGTCLQVRVMPSGDYAVSQYPMVDGRCALSTAGATASTVVENCSLHGTCRPTSRPASCLYTTRDINFYTGEHTHYPASADPSSPSGTNGFLYGVAKKKSGGANVHLGTSLSGTFQLLRLL